MCKIYAVQAYENWARNSMYIPTRPWPWLTWPRSFLHFLFFVVYNAAQNRYIIVHNTYIIDIRKTRGLDVYTRTREQTTLQQQRSLSRNGIRGSINTSTVKTMLMFYPNSQLNNNSCRIIFSYGKHNVYQHKITRIFTAYSVCIQLSVTNIDLIAILMRDEIR